MPNLLDDLACSTCDAYAHPFLDACPACGAGRAGRQDDARARGDLGYRQVLDDPRLERQLGEIVLRYSLKSAAGQGADRVRAGLGVILDAVPYAVRVVGPGAVTSGRANVHLAGDELVVEERSPTREVARVTLASVLAIRARSADRPAGAWAGLQTPGHRGPAAATDDSPPDVDGDLVLSYAAGARIGRLAIANRRGITAARARADHYVIVARALAVFAAAAAEARWIEVGADRHAAELGIAATPPPVAPPGPAGGPTGDRGDAGGAIAEALATLETLRERGLVTDTEYAEKRREILARL